MSSIYSITQAFQEIHRVDFIPDELKAKANFDFALPIGFGQTISQPTTVKLMLQWLAAMPGNKVLDLGYGSGWTSALLSYIVGPKGQVFAVERIPELVNFGRVNCKKVGRSNIWFFQAGEGYGLPENSPYDRILVSASADSLPEGLLDQLAVGGKLVIPIRNDILEIMKTSEHDYESKRHPGFEFVPLL